MARPTEETKKDNHVHYFVPGYKPEEKYCKCGAIQISQAEFERRRDEWNSYFELVRSSDSYRDYMEMKTATKAEQKEILKRVNSRVEKDDYMSKPSFPDPTTWNKYVTEAI